jgi:hypothetical protein
VPWICNINADITVKADTQATAVELLGSLMERNFSFTTHFISDVLTMDSVYSKAFQKTAGVLIGKEAQIRNLKDTVGALQLNDEILKASSDETFYRKDTLLRIATVNPGQSTLSSHLNY